MDYRAESQAVRQFEEKNIKKQKPEEKVEHMLQNLKRKVKYEDPFSLA